MYDPFYGNCYTFNADGKYPMTSRAGKGTGETYYGYYKERKHTGISISRRFLYA